MFIALGVACGQNTQITEPRKASSLRLSLVAEDSQRPKIRVGIQTEVATERFLKKIDDVLPGTVDMPLSGVPDGDYFVYFSSPGFAAQWQSLTVKEGKGDPAKMNVKLFRKRYVVLRYAFNTSGGRKLSGANIKEGRAAVAHWGSLPYFQQDWQIWQRSSEDDIFGDTMFGDTPFLDFHRYSTGFGFTNAPKGVPFEDLKEAPANAEYKCESTKAEKGLTLFCRVEADRKDGLGYGKVLVEDVTETPPAGVKRIEHP